MVNGMDSAAIPTTIKDWIAGKIARALPKRLIQKLLGMLIDNRDVAETLAYRERKLGDVPEFTLYMYKTGQAKQRHEQARFAQEQKEFQEAQKAGKHNGKLDLHLQRGSECCR